MKIEIWSDIVCPFCYIGKRKFDLALESFEGGDQVEITWRSFQLDPSARTEPGVSVIENLAGKKGISLEHSEKLHDDISRKAAEIGLEYNFDKAKVTNTSKAHQLIHLAAKHQLQSEAEEALFKAYFTDGKDLNEHETLLALAGDLGISKEETALTFEQQTYANEVEKDIQEAQQLGIRGVPFFIFNREFAVSGAQEVSVFSEALHKAAGNGKNPENIT